VAPTSLTATILVPTEAERLTATTVLSGSKAARGVPRKRAWGDENPQTKLNEKVYNWARLQLNKYVGGRECWDLADRALKHAGARSSSTTGKDDNYDWGMRVDPVTSVIRGDVLQFRNHVVRTTVVTTNTTTGEGESSWKDELRPHHTAVVATNNGAKGLEVFEQHWPEKKPPEPFGAIHCMSPTLSLARRPSPKLWAAASLHSSSPRPWRCLE